MPEIPDYDFRPSEIDVLEDEPQPRLRLLIWLLGGLGLIALVAALVLVLRGPGSSTTTEPAPTPIDVPEQAARGPVVEPLNLPPLDATDAIVRELVGKLSNHPRVAAWLATDNLLRSFTVVMTTAADGKTPAGRLTVLRPSESFRVIERGNDLVIDPASYARYNALTSAVGALDPESAARLFTQLKPRMEDAYRELGLTEPFDRTLEKAIREILATPMPTQAMRVEPKGIGYGYADERLEALSPVQKQLMRLGPDNLRIIQRQVRAIAAALGMRLAEN